MIQKKLHRFYLGTIPESDNFEIEDARVIHQLVKVLRFTEGEHIIVFSDLTDDYVVSITSITSQCILVKNESIIKNTTVPARTIIAAVSIIKRDHFELIVQKLTELGVDTIVPIIASRTIKQSVRLNRLDMISVEALEQCGGTKKVTILDPITLEKCLQNFPITSVYFHPDGKKVSDISLSEKIVMYIGPEGGWSEIDETLFKNHGVVSATLGNRILRSETAAIIGAHTLMQ